MWLWLGPPLMAIHRMLFTSSFMDDIRSSQSGLLGVSRVFLNDMSIAAKYCLDHNHILLSNEDQ